MKESSINKHRVLVLDGDHKNALAIVRHLASDPRLLVDVAATRRASVALFSRHARRRVLLPDPRREPEHYTARLLEILDGDRYLALIPVSYASFQLCSIHREAIRARASLVIAPPDAIALASDKAATYRLATSLGVPVPESVDIDNPDDYPLVIKAPREMGKNVVAYARDRHELERARTCMCRDHDLGARPPVIQRYIDGDGFGFFAYYRAGTCLYHFAHHRLREYPVTGGASTAAESFRDDRLVALGTRLLDALHWEGVAMVEFKRDRSTGTYYLMEINAKFWGSLELALVSGVNFPRVMIDEALGVETPPAAYTPGTRFQWVIDDLCHAIERPRDLPAFARDLFRARNDLRAGDPLPNLFQLAGIPVHYYKKFFR